MIVVADSSPFIALLNIGHLEVMPRLYGFIAIPTKVAEELAKANKPAVVQSFISSPPSWLLIRTPARVEAIPDLDPGECHAISLAQELHAEILLIDEKAGRDAAIARKLLTLRTTALLLDAAKSGVLPDLQNAYDKLRETNFRVPHRVLDELVARFEAFKRGQTSDGN